jgi:BirA family biotin operon repressor/biotin-[acetyl-CoA-carboxylase] ligase
MDPAIVEPLLRGRFGRPYIFRERCATTQELGRGLPEGAVAAADEQTAGRGRRGRRWVAPPGSAVLFSLSLRPQITPDRLAAFSLVAAEAVCAAAGPDVAVRWPNDVLAGGCKLAGVLCELREGQLVVGVGINANLAQDQLPAGTRVPATSLQLLRGAPVDRAMVLADVLWELESRYDRYLGHGFEGLQRDELRGRTVQLAGGRSGPAEGVDELGRLIVGGVAHSSAEVERVDV